MKSTAKKETKERLYSLDTLRGFDMLWIIGGGSLVGALAKATEWGWLEVVAHQMHHASWVGFHFEDLIFPLFMFISGVAIPYAITSRLEKGIEKSILYKKVFKRMILLIIFGAIYNGALKNGFSDLRWASVLSQIGIAYFFAALIIINTKTVAVRLAWVLGILTTITVLQLLVPVPDFGPGILTAEGSINSWIDRLFLPGRLYKGIYDPEGILSIVSAISVTLMGSFAGFILRNKQYNQLKKTKILIGIGIVLVTIALLLSPYYPIIKKIWTASFNILTAGISFLLLALFYYIIDVKMWRGWILFFKVIGLNSITIYLGASIIDFWSSSEFLLGWLAHPAGEHFGEVIFILGRISLEWLFLYYLYKNKIFLRV